MDNFLGEVRLSQADNDAAARLFTDGLAVARPCAGRDSPSSSRCMTWGSAARRRATWPVRLDTLKEGLAIAAEAGDETSAAYYLEALAAVAGQQDHPQRAVRLLFAVAFATASQWQRLAARLRAARPAR